MAAADQAAARDAYGHDLVPLPVQVGHDVNVQGQAADYGGWATYTTPAGADVARPVLPFDGNRHKATLIVSAVAAAAAGSTVANGSAASPVTANETIATTGALPAGTYTVTASTILTGTPTFADVNNVALKLNGTQIAVVPVQGASEQESSLAPITVIVPAGGVLSAATIGVGSGAAGYNVVLAATPSNTAAGGALVYVGSEAQCKASPPVGGVIPSGASVIIENNQQLWMIGDGVNSLRVTVLQERWDSQA